jgi:DeoR family suf operon transcriptional repressor
MTALEPPLAAVSQARRSVLIALKRHGSMHAGDIASDLGVTVAAVRQQLGRLEEDGLVARQAEASDRRGRPAHSYELTQTAEALFPKRYGDLTTELLGYLGGPESPEIADLFERRRCRRLGDAQKRLAGRSLSGKVAELARILDEDGYLADLETLDDGSWRITEHNCAILSVATGYRQACSSEIGFIREALPECKVDRVAHMMDGAHICAYEIRPGDG